MPSKAVATQADVQKIVGTTFPNDQADSGSWTAGDVTVKEDPKITIAGAAAIYEARCTFTLTGKKGNSPVTYQEDVVLTAGDTKLQSQRHVLRDGDTRRSSYGNTLQIASTRKLASG
jgi:hypothetical protein